MFPDKWGFVSAEALRRNSSSGQEGRLLAAPESITLMASSEEYCLGRWLKEFEFYLTNLYFSKVPEEKAPELIAAKLAELIADIEGFVEGVCEAYRAVFPGIVVAGEAIHKRLRSAAITHITTSCYDTIFPYYVAHFAEANLSFFGRLKVLNHITLEQLGTKPQLTLSHEGEGDRCCENSGGGGGGCADHPLSPSLLRARTKSAPDAFKEDGRACRAKQSELRPYKFSRAWGANYLSPTTPYIRAILALKEIEKKKNVYSKLRCISSCSAAIIESINRYYIENGTFKQPKEIGADDIQPIMIFVVIKANVANIYSHFAFIRQFVDEEQLKEELSEFDHKLTLLQEITCRFVASLSLDLFDRSGFLISRKSLDDTFAEAFILAKKEYILHYHVTPPTRWVADLILLCAHQQREENKHRQSYICVDTGEFQFLGHPGNKLLARRILDTIGLDVTTTPDNPDEIVLARKFELEKAIQEKANSKTTPKPLLKNIELKQQIYVVFGVSHPPYVYVHFSKLAEELASGKS
jgi:hypothetical protein